MDFASASNVHPAKFQFRVPEAMYIGQMQSAEGVKPDPGKVKAFAEDPQPKTKEDLRCFLGLANYLDEFISSVADVSEPLRVLLKNERMALP